MATEYIEKQAAIEALGEAPDNWIGNMFNLGKVTQWRSDFSAIETITPADVRPVVLCRDCKEYYCADNRVPEERVWVCSWLGRVMRPDDFCSLGERKGGNADGDEKD